MTVQTPPTQNDTRLLFVQEEYGYRHWVGVLPEGMAVESVIEWWKELPSVMGMFFNPSKSFPIDLYEVEDVAPDDADLAVMQWVDPEGQTHILDRKNVVLFSHTHEEDDSYLKIPQGETFYHAGHISEWYEEEEEEDLPPPTAEEIEDLKVNHPYVYKVLMDAHTMMEENNNGNNSSSTE